MFLQQTCDRRNLLIVEFTPFQILKDKSQIKKEGLALIRLGYLKLVFF